MGERGTAKPRAAILFVLLLAPAAAAQPITAKSHAVPPTITLSRPLTVTLTLEGPAPLRVDLPDPLLAPETAKGWRSKPLGPATVEKSGDREVWTQQYRLDPFDVPRDVETPVVFAGVKVNGTAQVWPPMTVTVETVWKKAGEVRPEDAHPVTGIEELPPPVPIDHGEVGWWVLGGAGAVFGVGLVVGLVRRWRAKPPPLPPREWALAALAAAGRDLTGRLLADRVAEVLRAFVDARHQLPAPRLTTAEVCREAEAAQWPAGSVEELRAVLDRCDRAKFAGAEPDAAEGHDLVARATRWVGG